MKRFIFTIMALSVVFALQAQITGFDLQRITDEDINGSSRYVGLSGAMAALGGDVAAVKDNAAALGVFRYTEASLSVSADFFGEKANKVSLPAVNAIIHFERKNASHNIMFAFQRRRAYHDSFGFEAKGLGSSQTDVMAALSEGLTYKDFDLSGIAYLAYAGFDGYLIDTVPGEGGKKWGSVEPGNVNAELNVRESGSFDDYSFGWGMNLRHRLYIGVNAIIRSLNYTKTSSYGEAFESGDRYSLGGSSVVTGVGIGLNAGVIWRPLPALRLAAAFQTPTASTLNFYYEGNMKSTVGAESYSGSYSTETTISQQLRLPMKVVLGLAGQLGERGLISFEYDYSHIKSAGLRDQHLLKVGAEWACTNNLFFDLGYAASLFGKYQQDTEINILDWDAPRLDSEQIRKGSRHYVSAGLSFRNRWLIAGVAYQYSLTGFSTPTQVWAHEMQDQPMGEFSDSQHRIVFTLGLRYRD